ncbi:MAG: hypothetical protein CMH25_04145 [Micavibrio sp.]|nr:hypothetical protein [Micavibrio sp.]|tara:strand:+ start:278 stop:790 length:513 start_codon:yes stop_codon:yes gene_type:complete
MNMDKERKTVVNIYAGMIASLIFQFAPNATLQILAILGFLAVFIWCYLARSQAEKDSLVANHTTYLIRSIWIFSLLTTIGVIVCVIWLSFTVDPELIKSLSQGYIETMSQTGVPDYSEDYMALIEQNLGGVLLAVLVTLGPSLIYLGYRLIKGARRGISGYRIDNPNAWL